MDFMLCGALVVLFTVTFLFYIINPQSVKRHKGEIPGRLGFPFIGETLSFLRATNSAKGCYDFVRTRRLRYGDWFKTRIFGKTHIFVPTVDGAKTVFKNDFGIFNKRFVKSVENLIGKSSIMLVPRHTHLKIRQFLSQPFSMNNIEQFVPMLDQMVSQKLKEYETNGKSFSLINYTVKVGFDILCNTLMSITDATLLEQLERDIKTLNNAMLTVPIMIPGTRYYKGVKARTRIRKVFKAIIGDRRSGKVTENDFLQSILERDSYPSDAKLNDEEILDNLLSLMISGGSSTATAMMWCVKFLSDNQHVQDKLRDEQLLIHKEIGDGATLTYQDLSKMSYASMVVKETLRMSNVLLWFPRMATKDCTLGDFEIKKGWYVNVDVSHIHYDPNIYKDPTRFDPSRFEEPPSPYTYIPFGVGPRVCLGINMAKVMMLIFLHHLTSGYTWTLDDQDPSLDTRGLVPKLRSGCPITLKSLNGESSRMERSLP